MMTTTTQRYPCFLVEGGGMKITEITGVKPIAPTTPDQSRIEGLKRQKDTAANNLKAERERQKLKKAQVSLAGIGAT